MNRIQFFVLTGLSSLVVVLLIGHIFLTRQLGIDQGILNGAQQRVNQGQSIVGNFQRLANTIIQDSQKTGDQGLKDILIRQQIQPTATPDSSNTPEAPAPSPSAPPQTH
jgi:hypothetical protein